MKTTSGNRFQVTAGHCWAENTTVTTELGGTVFGWVIFPKTSGIDAELIGGKSYGNRIFVGGTNRSSSEHVEGAADPLAGKYAHYCHSGRTTGEHCGHFVVSTLGLVCTNSGCKLPVSVFIGGTMIDEGDSGGPFYAYGADGEGVHIRGHVIAFGGNGLVGYAEKWSKVSASYGGLLIVT